MKPLRVDRIDVSSKDPLIGKEWKTYQGNKEVVRKIEQRLNHKGRDIYLVSNDGESFGQEIWNVSDAEKNIEQETRLYAANKISREETDRHKRDQDVRLAAMKDVDVEKFCASLGLPGKKAKIHLYKDITVNGKYYGTLAKAIKALLEKGYSPNGEKHLDAPSGDSWLELSATAIKFARFVKSKSK